MHRANLVPCMCGFLPASLHYGQARTRPGLLTLFRHKHRAYPIPCKCFRIGLRMPPKKARLRPHLKKAIVLFLWRVSKTPTPTTTRLPQDSPNLWWLAVRRAQQGTTRRYFGLGLLALAAGHPGQRLERERVTGRAHPSNTGDSGKPLTRN